MKFLDFRYVLGGHVDGHISQRQSDEGRLFIENPFGVGRSAFSDQRGLQSCWA